jgi:hypothetical protein
MIGQRKKEGQDEENGSGKAGKGLNKISGNSDGRLEVRGGVWKTCYVSSRGLCMTSAMPVRSLLWKWYTKNENGLLHFTTVLIVLLL